MDQLPPLLEMDWFHEMETLLADFLISPLVDLIRQYLAQPMTQLQKVYNPKTKTVSDQPLYFETYRFFELETVKQIKTWWQDDAVRTAIAVENVRFLVQEYAQTHNKPEMVDLLPCQHEPDTRAVTCFFSGLRESEYFISHPFTARLVSDVTSIYVGNWMTWWSPEDAVEFLFRRFPGVMNSYFSYRIALCNCDAFFDALIPRLPKLDWSLVDEIDKRCIKKWLEEGPLNGDGPSKRAWQNELLLTIRASM